MGTQLLAFSANVRCDQTAGWTKMPLGMEVGLGSGDCAGWGPNSPTQFWPMSIVAKWIKMTLGTEVNLGQSDVALYGDPASPTRKGVQLPVSAHVYFGQTAEWMKTPLGAEVDLGPVTLC